MLDANLLCFQDKKIYDALKAINQNSLGAVFIINNATKLVGVLTDGDIRRLLLEGKSLDDPIAGYLKKIFVFVKEGENYQEKINKLNPRARIVPVVNALREVVDYIDVRTSVHVPIVSPDLKGAELNYLTDAFLSSWISNRGQYLDDFEKKFAEFTGSSYATTASNGTAAIHLALLACGVGNGDEVIVPDLTFASTINAVLHAGANPVIVDIELDSWGINPEEIKKAITDKTKAIIPVHIYGQPCAMDQIMDIAKTHKFFVIEDCAEAHGAMYKGKCVGSIGDVGCFSFFGNKIITTGEGGMCVTNDHDLLEKIKVFKNHGMSPTKKYWHEVVGYNYRMTNLQAAIGLAQLERIESILDSRRNIESLYREKMGHIDFIEFQKNDLMDRDKITWIVSILNHSKNFNKIYETLNRKGYDVRRFFYPLSQMAIYKPYVKSNTNSVKLAALGMNLPTGQQVTLEAIANMTEIIQSIG